MTFTFSRVTKPPPIIGFNIGRKASIFSLGIDDFDDHRQVLESRRILAVCRWLDRPNPIGPRKTVAPARPVSRAFHDDGLVQVARVRIGRFRR